MKRSFLTQIAYRNALWFFGILLLLIPAIRNIFFMRNLEIPLFKSLIDAGIFGYQIPSTFQSAFFVRVIRFLLLFGCALFLQFISSEYRLIRVRSFFPFSLFCILSATILPVLPLNGASFSCFFFCWACFRLFAATDTTSTNHAVFDASFLLGIASLFQSRLLYILPVTWIALGIMQSLNVKSFLSSLFGSLSVFWIIGGISFLFQDYNFLLTFSNDLISFSFIDLNTFSPAEIIYILFLIILMISAMVSFWPKQNLDKLRTRNYLNSLLLLWFALFALWLFSGNDMGYLLLLFCVSSLMEAYFFSLIDTRYSRFMFIMLLLLSITVYSLFL
jgi:hypothetical protein